MIMTEEINVRNFILLISRALNHLRYMLLSLGFFGSNSMEKHGIKTNNAIYLENILTIQMFLN